MTGPIRADLISEHISRAAALGLDALANPAVSATIAHTGDGYIRTRYLITEDILFCRNVAASAATNCYRRLFYAKRPTRGMVKAVNFQGRISTVLGNPATIFSFSLGSSESTANDLAAPSGTVSLGSGAFGTTFSICERVSLAPVAFSAMILNTIVFPIGAGLASATMHKGTRFDVHWLPMEG